MNDLEGLSASTSYSPSTADLGSQPSDEMFGDLAASWQDAMQGAGMDANGDAVMDRGGLASNALYQPDGVNAPTLEKVGDNTSFHSQVVRTTAAQVQALGGKAIMEVPLTPVGGGPGPRIDLIYQMPGMPPVFVDVKTGDRPRDTPLQEIYYPLIPVGGHLLSNDPRIAQFGLTPGAPLPPLTFEYMTQRDANSPIEVYARRPRL